LELPPSFIFCLLSLNIPLVFLGGLPLKIFVDLEVVLLFHSFLVSLLLQGHPESFLLHLQFMLTSGFINLVFLQFLEFFFTEGL